MTENLGRAIFGDYCCLTLKNLQSGWAEICCFGCSCLQLFWARVIMRKWLNISTKDSDFSADTEDEDDMDFNSDVEGETPVNFLF